MSSFGNVFGFGFLVLVTESAVFYRTSGFGFWLPNQRDLVTESAVLVTESAVLVTESDVLVTESVLLVTESELPNQTVWLPNQTSTHEMP